MSMLVACQREGEKLARVDGVVRDPAEITSVLERVIRSRQRLGWCAGEEIVRDGVPERHLTSGLVDANAARLAWWLVGGRYRPEGWTRSGGDMDWREVPEEVWAAAHDIIVDFVWPQ